MDSGLSELFRQLPTGIVVIFCGSGILLIIALAYIVQARGKRARAALFAMGVSAAPATPGFDDSASADLPDLDTLASSAPLQAAPRPMPTSGSATYSITLTGGEAVEAVEVLSVLRDVSEGGLIIRIGDKAYRNPPAVADAEFKRRFHGTLRDLNVAQTPVEARPKPAPVISAAEDAPPSVDAMSSSEVPRFSPNTPMPGDLPKFRMPDGPPVKPKRGQRPVAEPIPEINIAGSIEAFLQHKLTMMPQYVHRSIHVRPAPHGGVQIEVDGSFYESVGTVEDEMVRQMLSSTIEEWQSRQ